jgi:hypothetical protein
MARQKRLSKTPKPQRLLDIAAQADAREGIRQGREDLKKGRLRPARKALEMFRRHHAIR